MKPVVLTSRARQDFRQAIEFYAPLDHALAVRFVDTVHAALSLIAQYPSAFPIDADDTRKYHLRRFPYSIAFTEQPKRVVVHAILHQKLRPIARD